MFENVDLKQSFPKLEEAILKKWSKENTFKKSIDIRKKENEYVFYDGPPFATGLPHYGHILAGTIKDVVPRFWTMRGKRIERRFGWDCHGLPVENIVEDELGLNGKNEILDKVGIPEFNKKCRNSVMKYTKEWEKVVERMGRWVDFYDDYKTMNPDFMESIWWVFKQLWEKDLIYEGMKPMHICPRCVTPLSNFEVTQGYKDITETSVIVKFEVKDEDNTFFLAWTTTPWTLPGNLLLAVGKDIDYVKVKYNNEYLILAKNQVESTFKDIEIEKIIDIDINKYINKGYKPLFDTLEKTENAFRVVCADFVTLDEGVGVVHCAGPYGEEDMNLCRSENIELKHHVNMDGTFTDDVKEWAGKDCKKMDQNIVKHLSDNNLLFKSHKFKHSYPHCWRCDTPLLNYATSSWFVNVTKIKDRMIENNQKIHWVPDHIKDGRFGRWLEGARDWAISRARFWGTPLPIWKSEDGDTLCIGSINELQKLSGIRVNDLHKDVVDEVEININGKIYKRIEDVLDCWFESGSMPYAQRNYPFSEVPTLNNNFYLMRHGESESNTQEIFSSKIDSAKKHPLTKNGRKIAQESVNNINAKIDLIFSSDFRRTKETAEIVGSVLNIPIEYDIRLREVDAGSLDGKDYHDCDKSWPKGERLHTPAPDGGETYTMVKERMLEFISEINEKYKDKNILIVSHGAPIKLLQSAFIGTSKDDIINTPYPEKGVIKKLEVDNELKKFDDVFPAEFIAEGQDQTRGWFYTLTVLSTALFDKPAFKNCIVNGIILAEDGKKMSKRLKNYPDPVEVFDKYGADALRFYLLQSPVVKADDLRFSEKGVKDVVKNTILPLWNSYCFFITYAQIDNWKPTYKNIDDIDLSNPLDKWIVSRLFETIKDITEYMENYDLQKSTEIGWFIDDLTNWYIRRSRRRFWKSENDNDKDNAYSTLHYVLVTLSKAISPFMPFISEAIYTNLTDDESVHLSDWPEINSSYINDTLNKDTDTIRRIVKLGHSIRARKNIKVRQPLKAIDIALDKNSSKEIEIDILKDELNIKEVNFIEDSKQLANKVVLPDAKKIGPRFGKKTQDIIRECKNGNFSFTSEGSVSVLDEVLSPDELDIRYIAKEGFDVDSDNEILVAIDTNITDELKKEGQVRELIRYIQDLRKEADYNVSDRINLKLCKDGLNLINGFEDVIKKETLTLEISKNDTKNDKEILVEIDDIKVTIGISK